jgi:hypothetical protein
MVGRNASFSPLLKGVSMAKDRKHKKEKKKKKANTILVGEA